MREQFINERMTFWAKSATEAQCEQLGLELLRVVGAWHLTCYACSTANLTANGLVRIWTWSH